MPDPIQRGYYLLLLKQQPFVETQSNKYYIARPSGIGSIASDLIVLHELLDDQTISHFEYIEESKVIVIETESRLAPCSAKKSRNQGRRQSTSGHLWSRASVRCMETS